MSQITIENWEKQTVKKSNKYVFSIQDLKDHFEELAAMTDEQIASYLEASGGYVNGMRLSEACIHIDEEECIEELGIEDSGISVFVN